MQTAPCQLTIHVWELDPDTGRPATDWPTFTHVFAGETPEECEELLGTHRGVDEMLDAAFTDGEWKGIGMLGGGVWTVNGVQTPWRH